MKLVKAGISPEEYCEILCNLVKQGGWDDGDPSWEGAFYGKSLCIDAGVSWPPC